ncbi:MAG: response regulator [Burkholderiales bacterium]|nr:response regulator [Burkholderiales bacterium]
MLQEASPPPATILVVDDAPQNIKLLRVILKDAGYRVVEASSGPEALALMKREKPDAMVLDVRMPGMTGYEVCRQVRGNPEFATLPVIMLTALSQPEERVMGIEAGATDFISKPFNKKELMARVQASLALNRGMKGGAHLQLSGVVIIADADWKIAAATPAALRFLAPYAGNVVGLDIAQILASKGVAVPADDTAVLTQPWLFRTVGTDASPAFSGRYTLIKDPDENIALRVIMLHPEQAPPA